MDRVQRGYSENGGRDQKPKSAGSLWKLKKKERHSTAEPPKGMAAGSHLDLSPGELRDGLVNSRTALQ